MEHGIDRFSLKLLTISGDEYIQANTKGSLRQYWDHKVHLKSFNLYEESTLFSIIHFLIASYILIQVLLPEI